MGCIPVLLLCGQSQIIDGRTPSPYEHGLQNRYPGTYRYPFTVPVGFSHGAFLGCKNLKEVPEDTFKYNTEVTDFSLAFWACSNLTKVPDLSNNTKVVKISMMFSDCVKLTGEVYPIWNNGLITSHSKTFNGCSKLSNYSEIPAGWK